MKIKIPEFGNVMDLIIGPADMIMDKGWGNIILYAVAGLCVIIILLALLIW
jgi:hypothetical protein